MQIVDAQLHEPGPWMNWDDASESIRNGVLTEALLSGMDAVGVERAVLFPTAAAYEGWAQQVALTWPNRFTSVLCFDYGSAVGSGLLDPTSPDIESRVAELRDSSHVRGLRLVVSFPPEGLRRFQEGLWDRAIGACEKCEMPLFLFCSGHLDVARSLAMDYPNLGLVIDHLGVKQRPVEEMESPAWRRIPELVELARFPNVAVKMCGVPSLSSECYPYEDTWGHVRRVVDAFGPERIMWASDISRFRGRIGWRPRLSGDSAQVVDRQTYAESLSLFRDTGVLSEDEKDWVLGGTARRVLRW
jgi:L-fuconolactonase